MALTPEDVLNKNFTPTQFRRGYDEREVDDFLDEVVAEMRRLVKGSDDLREQLDECRQSKGMAPVEKRDGDAGQVRSSAATGEADDAEAKATEGSQERISAIQARAEEAERVAQERVDAANARAEEAEKAAQERIATLNARVEEAEQAALGHPQGQPVDEEGVPQAGEQAAAEEGDGDGEGDGRGAGALGAAAAGGAASAAGLIELAQRLHDQHVGEGQSTRDRLISEGQSQHDELVSQAQARHEELVTTGQSRHDELLSAAQSRHDQLIGEAQARHEQMITEARERSTGMVHEAQQRKTQILEELNRERGLLEKKIEELRGFERDYRARLKAYIESQLEELESTGVGVESPSEGEQAEGADEGQQG